MTVELNSRSDLTLDAARRVSRGGEGVRVGAAAQQAMAAARAGFERLMDEPGIVIYGVTSGYGQRADQKLSLEERTAHARVPLWAVQAHAGASFPPRVTRLMVLARLANLIEGHAAVRPVLAKAVAAMLDGPLPEVPIEGAVSAGEILPLGYLFGPLVDSIEPVEKEVLALENGAPVAAALVTDAALTAARRLAFAEEIFALAAEAYRIPTGHFSPETACLWGDPHEIATAERLSALIADGGAERRPYQAPVSFRILPKMLGRLRREAARAEEIAAISLSQVSDNPVYFPPDAEHPNGRILSTGGYHNAAAWPAINALAMGYADLCTLAGRLIARLLDGRTSGLPDQLLAGPEDHRYLGTLGFSAVGYEEAARRAAQAVLLPGSDHGGFVQNDVSVPTSIAFEGHERAGLMLDKSLGALALVVSQAFHVTERPAPPALAETLRRIRAWAPPLIAPAAPGPLADAIARGLTDHASS